jgi:hypothetical protein
VRRQSIARAALRDTTIAPDAAPRPRDDADSNFELSKRKEEVSGSLKKSDPIVN